MPPEWGRNRGANALLFPIVKQPSTAEVAEKEFELSEPSEFSNSRQLGGAQGIRHRRTSYRVPFLLVRFSLGKAKKMNNNLTFFTESVEPFLI
jgi:hypothetical protein